ncbi:hypothetical protein EGW08_009996 [Elysia chlorotica]|uniref:Carbohydrate sulfotransferase n=1 Tax=Elysia chlorotica TaxID=188477 RepID=A0A433TL21_ELYCH|nr:hypothetical protein EGW08_009996 [Elysia chlorotica]
MKIRYQMTGSPMTKAAVRVWSKMSTSRLKRHFISILLTIFTILMLLHLHTYLLKAMMRSLLYGASDLETMEAFETRQTLLDARCINMTKEDNGDIDVMTHTPHKLLYCPVPKAGKTFWVRVFRFISGDVPNHVKVKSVFDVDREFAHYAPWKEGVHTKYKLVNKPHFPRKLKFLVARDPYERILSAYIDKIFLMDFWFSHGSAIIDQRDRLNMMAKANADGSRNVSRCPYDITVSLLVTLDTIPE